MDSGTGEAQHTTQSISGFSDSVRIGHRNFWPMREARRLLDAFGVPPSARIVLFVAEHTNYLRKGFTLLDSALGRLKDISDVALISLGRGKSPLSSRPCRTYTWVASLRTA